MWSASGRADMQSALETTHLDLCACCPFRRHLVVVAARGCDSGFALSHRALPTGLTPLPPRSQQLREAAGSLRLRLLHPTEYRSLSRLDHVRPERSGSRPSEYPFYPGPFHLARSCPAVPCLYPCLALCSYLYTLYRLACPSRHLAGPYPDDGGPDDPIDRHKSGRESRSLESSAARRPFETAASCASSDDRHEGGETDCLRARWSSEALGVALAQVWLEVEAGIARLSSSLGLVSFAGALFLIRADQTSLKPTALTSRAHARHSRRTAS